jgi:protein SCO1
MIKKTDDFQRKTNSYLGSSIILAILLIACSPRLVSMATAHPGHSHSKPVMDSISSVKDIAPSKKSNSLVLPDSGAIMGFEEKPGAMVPLDGKFANQKGDSVTFSDCVKGPTIACFLYYRCTDECGVLLSGLARILRSYADNPNAAPNVVTLSIGGDETTAEAMKTKEIAHTILQWAYPEDRWHFLTGSAENIKKVTAAVGFHFVKKGEDYDHPLGLVILSGQGKITRYILGTDFLPSDITLSLMEASKGSLQPTIARVVRACFSYDPKSHRLVFKTLQVSATVILTLLVVFITFLIKATISRKSKGQK